jgi:hypothetical protein
MDAMRLALVLALAVTLSGCVTGPTILPGSAGTLDEMRADLMACEKENLAFALIPDFGSTANFHRRKCMRQRGWSAGADRGSGVPDFYRVPPDYPTCPENYAWNGNGCSRITSTQPGGPATTEPTWATGE